MPIKDLSETVRLPRLGKIHLGIKDPVKGYPMKTDYFVLPKDHSDYKALVEAFGDKPKELRILIPVEDSEQWASQYYKAYTQTHGLVCKGDGVMAMRMMDVATNKMPSKTTETVTMVEFDCAGRDCPDYQARKCKQVMNLRFILPEVPGLGIWQIDTSSTNSILNINSAAALIRRSFGRISLVPLKLTMEPLGVNNPEDGKKQTVYVLNLRTSVTLAQLADAAREQVKELRSGLDDLEAVYDVEQEQAVETLWPGKKVDTEPDDSQAEQAPAEKPKVKKDSKKKPRDPKTVKTINDLFKACNEDFKMQPPEVLAELNAKTQNDITELPAECYERIAAARK